MNTLSKKQTLYNANKKLVAEWHPTKNGDLTPKDVLPKSSKKVWWQCQKGHEWQAVIAKRSNGTNCPYCSGNKVCTDNSLQFLYPEIASEWSYENNIDITPNNVTAFSGKKVWWKCEKGHEWKAEIKHRTKGSGCPYCSNLKVSSDNSLAFKNSELAKQWNFTKNGNITPHDVTSGSSSKKFWWKCENKNHPSWEATVNDRSNGYGCPYCAGRKVCDSNSLATLYPLLSKEWDYNKNENLTPKDVTASSNKKVWWKCNNIEHPSYQAIINSRTNGSGCPYCAGKAVCDSNSLFKINPRLASEWDYKKNKGLTPSDVTIHSNKKVWWRCLKGHPSWFTSVNSRTNGNNCPKCAKELQTSFPEQAIFYYLKKIIPEVINTYILENDMDKFEIDVFIPEFKIGIEYDGVRYHSSDQNIKNDELKNLKLAEAGIYLIRIREEGCPTIKSHGQSIVKCKRNKESSLIDAIRMLIEIVNNKTDNNYQIDINLNRDRNEIFELYIIRQKETSLQGLFPEIAKEWDMSKNKITSDMVSPFSSKKAWWICKDKGHSWQAVIANRSKGSGCPYCEGKTACSDNSLATLNPLLASEWDFEKNRDLTPNNVTVSSGKKVWWKCEKGHSWQATIASRNDGRGCPYCTGSKVCIDNSLATLKPQLIEEWDFNKNKDLTPENVTVSSTKKAWWKCEKGHSWQARIADRSKGSGCPLCWNEGRSRK